MGHLETALTGIEALSKKTKRPKLIVISMS